MASSSPSHTITNAYYDPNDPNLPPEIATAYKEGRARGVPDGWRVTIDKRNRRKWTAPNGRSCDSIPKALAISVELGLLPPDTVIPHGGVKRQRTLSAQSRQEHDQKKKTKRSKKTKGGGGGPTSSDSHVAPVPAATSASAVEEEESSDDDEVNDSPPEPLDPEVMLDGLRQKGAPTTVHWDPNSLDGRKIGWKVKIQLDNHEWKVGRVTRYDPYSHKHKIQLDNGEEGGSNSTQHWLWLRNENHNLQLATRLVWAHVKGYAWWPAWVMESNNADERRDGYVHVEFFMSGEVSHLRDTDDCIRPFVPDSIDPVVAKHKKKRNAKAFQMAVDECRVMQHVRNAAATFYARKALDMVNAQADLLLGCRVQVFRSDCNYPYGDTVCGTVRMYSPFQKKWLVSFEVSDKTRAKYDACWLNLQARECALRVLDKPKKKAATAPPTAADLVPYVVGYSTSLTQEPLAAEDDSVGRMLSERCRCCLEYWKSRDDDVRFDCQECGTRAHLSCLDPPLPLEFWQRMLREGTPLICSRCVSCRGCYNKDVCFGSHLHPMPACLTLESGPAAGGGAAAAAAALQLCSMCKDAYEAERFCPNCAHTWDDVKFEKVRRQIEYVAPGRKKQGTIDDGTAPILFGSFTGDQDDWPTAAKVDPTWFYPETSEWGYTEVEMLVCDSCKVWVHAGCAGIGEEEYNQTSDGDHPIYSKEFLCRMCCRKRCKDIVQGLQAEDTMHIFALPVTDKMAHNYSDVIKMPMDLQNIERRAERDKYLNYAWVRELFELMVLNALTFNRQYTKIWMEAYRYYNDSLKKVFAVIGKAAPPGKYHAEIKANLDAAEDARKKEIDRVQVDESVEKKDLVAGSAAATVTLSKLRESLPDEESCVNNMDFTMSPVEAFYSAWLDSCFTCGSSGAADTFLFCVDCGEAYHSFCANAPVRSMELASLAGWRCPNCKICEICADVPKDDSRLVFCEMCDRAFTLDLLDPPLAKAPAGLWICGQCVNCKTCNNTAEPGGPSLRQWSCDPDKCYRCGGCAKALDPADILKCNVCHKLLRDNDEDVIECKKCGGYVHGKCDVVADEHLQAPEDFSRAQKAQKVKEDENSYECPLCAAPTIYQEHCVPLAPEHLGHIALASLDLDVFGHEGEMTVYELHDKLVDSIEWLARDMYRDEYIAVIRDAVLASIRARDAFGDARRVVLYVMEHIAESPRWMGQRALRFIHLARKGNWEDGIAADTSIERLATYAKLGAAFLRVASHSLGINLDTDVPSVDRVRMLSEHSPSNDGAFIIPADHIMVFADSITAAASRATAARGEAHSKPSAATKGSIVQRAETSEKPIVATSLCGWPAEMSNGDIGEWKDPRECCLCHICGDDDAGTLDMPSPAETDSLESYLRDLGRLLPMPQGYWVHTSCALWSSEVWEKASDGLIHAADKARSRGSQLKCFGCGQHGATVGCNKSNCNFNYHFPCAKACGAAFTATQEVFCAQHRSTTDGILPKASFEFMKTLIVEHDKKSPGELDSSDFRSDLEMCPRVGALLVHALGEIETKMDGFHTENYITPPGYVATRIFWSTQHARARTVYVMKIERSRDDKPEYSILPGDHPEGKIVSNSVATAYSLLMDRVRKCHAACFSHGNLLSKKPQVRRTRRKTFGLNGPQFFGFGVEYVRKLLEASPGSAAVVVPLTPTSPKYKFCFVQPSMEAILDLTRKRAAVQAEQALENQSGCARVEGLKAVTRSGGSGRITRALVRSAEEDDAAVPGGLSKKAEDKAQADRSLNQVKYRRMKAIPMEDRLVTRRSHIHGWGLFTKMPVAKDNPVVEYMGEIIRQPVADVRERQYEATGEGSCYMFRLDLHRIVDATMIGCMARFMNHSCDANAYAKIIAIDIEGGGGQERKIVIFAKRDIAVGEEVTYDYKFQVEDGSLRCTCGAPNCIGRLN